MSQQAGFGELPLVADTSAWIYAQKSAVAPTWAALFSAGRLVACPVVLVELANSARDESDFAGLKATVDALRLTAPIDQSVIA